MLPRRRKYDINPETIFEDLMELSRNKLSTRGPRPIWWTEKLVEGHRRKWRERNTEAWHKSAREQQAKRALKRLLG